MKILLGDFTAKVGRDSSIVACIFVATVTLFTEPLLPSNAMGIQTDRLMGGTYEIRHREGLGCHTYHV
jgi:hypothetical protein